MDLGNLNLGNLNLGNGGLMKVIEQIISSGKNLFSVDELKSLAGGDYKNVLKKLYDAKALVTTKEGEKADIDKLKGMLGKLPGNLGNLGGLGNLFK